MNFEYDKLIVGSSLEALVYSYLHNIPLVCSRLAKPWRFDFFEPDYNLEIFNLKNIIQILKNVKQIIEVSKQRSCWTETELKDIKITYHNVCEITKQLENSNVK